MDTFFLTSNNINYCLKQIIPKIPSQNHEYVKINIDNIAKDWYTNHWHGDATLGMQENYILMNEDFIYFVVSTYTNPERSEGWAVDYYRSTIDPINDYYGFSSQNINNEKDEGDPDVVNFYKTRVNWESYSCGPGIRYHRRFYPRHPYLKEVDVPQYAPLEMHLRTTNHTRLQKRLTATFASIQ